jgi:hypothetical protein
MSEASGSIKDDWLMGYCRVLSKGNCLISLRLDYSVFHLYDCRTKTIGIISSY